MTIALSDLQMETEMDELEAELAAAQQSAGNADRIRRLETDMSAANEALQHLERENKEMISLLEQYESESQELRGERDQASSERAELSRQVRRVPAAAAAAQPALHLTVSYPYPLSCRSPSTGLQCSGCRGSEGC